MERILVNTGENVCFCLSQSTSKWQIIMCLCQEEPTTTTMPMWNLFLTLLNAYLFRYHHILHSIPRASAQQLIIYFLSLNKYLFCVSYRQFGLAGVMPQRTPNSQSCFTKMALPSWVKDISYFIHWCFSVPWHYHAKVFNLLLTMFAGPPSQAMWALGDKIASSIVAQTAGIPTLPWSGTGRSRFLKMVNINFFMQT